jgi:putative aldouronate transport system substrate-binding protein
MNSRKRRLTAKFTIGLMTLAAVVSGCSNPDVTPSASDTTKDSKSSNLAAAGFPIVQEPISLRVFGCRDANHAAWKDVLVFKEYEKKTNVKMNFEETPQQGCDEKRNLLFASNDLPDIFLRSLLTNEDLARYGMKDQTLIPLEGLIDKYAPNMKALLEKYPDARKTITAPDGHIYSLPMMRVLGSERSDKIWINKTWLEKLNLKAPRDVEELKTVLRSFRDNDPNGNGKQDEIPLGFRDMGHVYRAFGGSYGLDFQLGYNINIDNNKIKIWFTDDRYKEMLTMLSDLYKEKLLWSEFYKKDLPKWRSNLSQALFGQFFIQASDPFTNVESQFTGMKPIIGPHGEQKYSHASPIAANGAFSITKMNKNPEASIRWVDYFFGEEGSLFFRFGVEGQTYTMKDGMPIFNDSILKDQRGFMAAVGQVNLSAGGGFPHLVIEKTGGPINNEKVREVQSFIEPYIPKQIYGAPIFDVKTAEEVLVIKADIDKFVSESSAKFILGELSFDKWKDYVDTLNKMGMGNLEQAYQKAYDAGK